MQEFVDGVRTVPSSGVGSFAFFNVPAGTYYLQASPKLHMNTR